MKKLLYKLLPNSLREIIKLNYYNLKINTYKFGLKDGNYTTKYKENWSVITNKPLYFIVRDLDRYEKHYTVKVNDTVIDGGANEGSLSVVYSEKVGKNGSVFAFEPDSENIKTLEQNLELNPNSKNVELVKKGLWDNNGGIEFYQAGTVGSSVFYKDEKAEKVIINTISIDGFSETNNLQQLNFVKMDIEGAEIKALEGFEKSIKKYSPEFAIASYHIVDNEPTYKALEDFFDKIGYPYITEFFDDGEIITYAGNSVKR